MDERHEKDIHRFSHSRLETFKCCPRKHHYAYIEKIPTPDNEYLLKGKLVHECIEYVLKGEDPQKIYDEWKKYVDKGIIIADRDQLEYTINMYFSYWYHEYNKENTLLVEQDFQFNLDDDDYFVGRIDQAYELSGFLFVRDYKTTSGQLKYEPSMVKTNSQLLLYTPPVEKILDRQVNGIEIDEIRIAKLDTEVPKIKSGKPSTSLDVLSLTTAELYREELERQNLIDDPKYSAALALLEQRGHPLFRRVKVQLTNRNIIETNIEEIQSLYVGASIDLSYRIKDPQKCWMCPYKQLCEHDEYKVDDMLRNQIIDNISR